MPETIKCNSCNIVINELLSYIQNKISIIDEETLVRICSTSFTSEEIKQAKSLLFEAVPTDKMKINRKNKGKEGRDLIDILNLFKSTEPNIIPIFVARELEKLPPILFDHLDCTKLLKDLLKVQSELDVVKANYVTKEQLSECRSELLQLRNDSLLSVSPQNVSVRRGAWQLYESGPVDLSHDIDDSTLIEPVNNQKNSSSDNIQEYREMLRVNLKQNARKSAGPGQRSPVLNGCENTMSSGMERRAEVTSLLPALSSVGQCADNCIITTEERVERHSAVNTAGEFEPNENDKEGWKTVSRRKKFNYRYHGKAGISRDMEGGFKAADKKVPIFITKIHMDTTDKDIINYVYRKTKEMITLEEITLKLEKNHKAFKFFVLEKKLSTFLDSNLWPEGVIFRRFINFRQRSTNSNYTVSADQKPK